jgi:hypothetical protein
MSDSWPDRVGIPVLEEVKGKLIFVGGCLSPESEKRQRRAGKRLMKAFELVQESILILKGER